MGVRSRLSAYPVAGLTLLMAVAVGFLATLATPQPVEAAAPVSTPWLHTHVPAHLGFQMYWWDGFTPERDASVTGYDVQYREAGTTSWISHPHSGTVRAVEISNLAEGRQYQIRVRATNSDGNGPWSEVSTVPSVGGYAAIPNPPFPVVVEAGNASASVTWGRPSHTGGRTLTGYVIRVLYHGTETLVRTIEVSGAATASALIAGLTNGTEYDLDMFATYGESDDGGRQTGRFEFTPTGSLPTFGVAVSLSATPNPVLEGQSVGVTAKLSSRWETDVRIPVLIKWGKEFRNGRAVDYGDADNGDLYSYGVLKETQGNGETYYSWWIPTSISIYSGSHGRIDGINNMETRQDGDSNDDAFTVLLDTGHPDWPARVTAGDVASVKITITDIHRPAPPGAPTDIRFTEGDGRLDVSWKAPLAGRDTVTGYDVQYSLNPLMDDGWTAVDRSGTETAQTITGLENGRLVWVRVRAVNAHGSSDWLEGTGRPTAPAPRDRGSASHALSGVWVCWDTSATGGFSDCGSGRIRPYGYREPALFAADGGDATHVKLTLYAEDGATIRAGKMATDGTVTLTSAGNGTQGAAIALNTDSRTTTFRVEVTHSGGVNTYTVSIQKPVGGL